MKLYIILEVQYDWHRFQENIAAFTDAEHAERIAKELAVEKGLAFVPEHEDVHETEPEYGPTHYITIQTLSAKPNQTKN